MEEEDRKMSEMKFSYRFERCVFMAGNVGFGGGEGSAKRRWKSSHHSSIVIIIASN
jgi:hypothetical protein